METQLDVISDLKTKNDVMSKTLAKVVTVCVSIITFLLTLMVGFVWNLKADFATEQAKTNNIQETVKSINDGLKETNKSVQALEKSSLQTDFKIESIEQKISTLGSIRTTPSGH